MLKKNELEALPHKTFMEYMAEAPHKDLLWTEFQKRYQKYISRNICKTCLAFDYQEGLSYLEDIEQEVYTRLLEKNRVRLKNFTGKNEYSIFRFLATVSNRAVLNHISANNAKKRIPLAKRTNLDTPIAHDTFGRTLALKDLLPADEMDMRLPELEDLTQKALDQALAGNPFHERDRLIFEKYFFEGKSPREIAELAEIEIRQKSVSNIVSQMKKSVRLNLVDLMYGALDDSQPSMKEVS